MISRATEGLRKPATAGLAGALGLVGLYIGIVRIGSASWLHVLELLLADWYFVAAVATGFGVQVGLFTYSRQALRGNHGTRSAAAMTAGGTATSTTSMVACCLHHLADVLPVIGLSGAAVFFTTYKVPVILFGLATNALGIGMMVRTVRRHVGMVETVQRTPHPEIKGMHGAVVSDRVLVALILVAGGTFVVTVAWLLLVPR